MTAALWRALSERSMNTPLGPGTGQSAQHAMRAPCQEPICHTDPWLAMMLLTAVFWFWAWQWQGNPNALLPTHGAALSHDSHHRHQHDRDGDDRTARSVHHRAVLQLS